MKAMILAAGRGERMRPLTDTIPKPLIPLGEGRLIEPLLYALHRSGIREVVINVCYLAQQIMDYLQDGSRYGLNIQYSLENEVGGLETGGGVFQALPLLGVQPFLLISADIVSDYPFGSLIKKPLSGLAHLVFVDNPEFHAKGDFHLSEQGEVFLKGDNTLNFAGICLLHPDLFKNCSPGKFPLSRLFKEAIAAGLATGEHYRGVWHNIGTPAQLESLKEIDLLHVYKNN
jgi:MurNAc alpha-1-phosphate uridylyltransferase